MIGVDVHAEARRRRLGLRLLPRCPALLGFEIELADGDVHRLTLPVAIDGQRDSRPWLRADDHRDERITVDNRLAVEFGDDVTALQPGLARRLTFGNRGQHGAVGVRQAERLRIFLGQRVGPNLDTDDAANDFSRPELRQDGADRINWRGESDPDIGRTLIGVDGGVHADDFAANVEQRPAGVPRD